MNSASPEMAASSSDRPRHIVIVGAGISGLAAAWELKRLNPSYAVTILESTPQAGGVLDTIIDPPYLIERSADNFATLIPDALNLCREIGYNSELISPQEAGRQAFVLHGGHISPIPVGFSLVQPTRVWPILSTPTLSWRGKLRLLSEYFVPQRTSDEDESLLSFATRRLGREAFERLVEPIVSGIFTADPAQLSMQATLAQFVKMEREHGGLIRGYLAARRQDAAAAARRASGARYDQFVAPRQGMRHWVEALQAALPATSIQFQQRVATLERPPAENTADGRWKIQTTSGQTLSSDGVILATPTAQSAQLLASVQPQLAAALGRIQYASSAVAILAIDRQEIHRRTDGFGLIVPSIERRPVLAISYSSNKYAGRAPDDQLLLRIFMGGALQPEVLQQSDSELSRMAEQQLKEILGWTGAKCRWQGIVRWNNAMPQYHVGHCDLIEQIRQHLTSLGALRLCGAGYSGVGIPQCVRSGRQAAAEIHQVLQSTNAH